MTYGFWLDKAAEHLRDINTHLTTAPPADITAVLAAAGARREVYRALARHVGLLAGHPTPRSSPDAGAEAGRNPAPIPNSAALCVSLLKAAAAEASPPAPPRSPPGLTLHHAADALEVAADLLASHTQPGRRARTQEGHAICTGAGVAAGLADLAQLTADMLAVDVALARWAATTGHAPHRDAVRPLLDALRVRVDPHILRGLIAASQTRPSLLRSLGLAPQIGLPAGAVDTVDDAAAALRGARIALWQHPDQVRAVHARAGTRVALAVTAIAPHPDHADVRQLGRVWRRAAQLAHEVRGSAPAGDGVDILQTLADVLRWTHDRTGDVTTTAVPVFDLLRAELGPLAQALDIGMGTAAERGDLFTGQTELRNNGRGPIKYAVIRWRQAGPTSIPITDLRGALLAATYLPAEPQLRSSPARTAFARAPRLDAATATIRPAAPPPVVATAHHRRGRTG